ncbi:MAG: hypothetical protein HYX75_20695 [Acidobacteria bacterium]|nr:hypothetical protein [Acidobacteriota bacterium]
MDEWKTDLAQEQLALDPLENDLAARIEGLPHTQRAEFLGLRNQCRKHPGLVKTGNGVHNYDYAKPLLTESRARFERALHAIPAERTAPMIVDGR